MCCSILFEAPPRNPQCKILVNTFRCLVEAMSRWARSVFWWQKVDVRNIRQVAMEEFHNLDHLLNSCDV